MESNINENESSDKTPAIKKRKTGNVESWIFKQGHFVKNTPQSKNLNNQ